MKETIKKRNKSKKHLLRHRIILVAIGMSIIFLSTVYLYTWVTKPLFYTDVPIVEYDFRFEVVSGSPDPNEDLVSSRSQEWVDHYSTLSIIIVLLLCFSILLGSLLLISGLKKRWGEQRFILTAFTFISLIISLLLTHFIWRFVNGLLIFQINDIIEMNYWPEFHVEDHTFLLAMFSHSLLLPPLILLANLSSFNKLKFRKRYSCSGLEIMFFLILLFFIISPYITHETAAQINSDIHSLNEDEYASDHIPYYFHTDIVHVKAMEEGASESLVKINMYIWIVEILFGYLRYLYS